MIWWIGIGGSIGAAARYLLGRRLNNRSQFPAGTWLANITGSFLLGWLARLYMDNEISEWIWLFWGVGFCGAYTTFSTFGHETVSFIQSGQMKQAVSYVTASLAAGLAAASIGLFI